MKRILETFRAIFPHASSSMVWVDDTSTIVERESGAELRKAEWTNSEFLTFDPGIAKTMSGFFKSQGAVEIFRKDCDGVMMFENGSERYMYLTELKTSFGTKEISKAKSQILSTFLKMNMLLNLAPGYKTERLNVKGFIISREPDAEFKSDLRKSGMLAEARPDYRFCHKLIRNGECTLNPTQAIKSWDIEPSASFNLRNCKLGERGIFSSIALHYIPLPKDADFVTLDAKMFL